MVFPVCAIGDERWFRLVGWAMLVPDCISLFNAFQRNSIVCTAYLDAISQGMQKPIEGEVKQRDLSPSTLPFQVFWGFLNLNCPFNSLLHVTFYNATTNK